MGSKIISKLIIIIQSVETLVSLQISKRPMEILGLSWELIFRASTDQCNTIRAPALTTTDAYHLIVMLVVLLDPLDPQIPRVVSIPALPDTHHLLACSRRMGVLVLTRLPLQGLHMPHPRCLQTRPSVRLPQCSLTLRVILPPPATLPRKAALQPFKLAEP